MRFTGWLGGKNKKLPGPSVFSFSILLEDLTFVYTGGKLDRNWLVDDELNYEQHVFDQVQLTLLGAGAQPLEDIDDIESGGMMRDVCGGSITLAMSDYVGGRGAAVEVPVAVPVDAK